jgi:sugar phosphate isomerase/epimerase
MRIAGYTYSFAQLLDRKQIDTVRIIRYYRELGVDAVEITGGYVRDEEIPAVRAALAETGMAVACYDLVCDVVTPDAAQRQARAAQLKVDLKKAAGVGARVVLVVPGPPRDNTPHDTLRQWFAEALRECLPEASRLGVTMTVADVGWQPVVYGTSAQINAICDAAGPGLRVTYDVGNFLLCGEGSLEGLDRVAPRVVHVHFKDWEIVPAPKPQAFPGLDGKLYLGAVLGDGIVDLPGAVARLRKLGYKGCVSVEYEGVGDPHDAACRGVAYLRSLLN